MRGLASAQASDLENSAGARTGRVPIGMEKVPRKRVMAFRIFYPNHLLTRISGTRFSVNGPDSITLINLWEDKGGLVLQEIAKWMPEYKFLGVKGGYGHQEVCSLKNIEYVENTPEIKKMYAKSRIVLMPSKYESYGRVAVEAMASGIPVIAQPTPGLKESLGNAGIFCDRDKIDEWVETIKKLDDEKEYKAASKAATERFKEIEAQTAIELQQFEDFLYKIISKRA